jgi:TPR repeat protein
MLIRVLGAVCAALLCLPPALAAEPSLKSAETAWNSGDVATALAQWQALAQQGDIIAANNLGYLYDNGVGVPKDPAKAVFWYRKVAEAGAPIGQLNLGNAYWYGRGIDKDPVEAAKWLTLAAAGGDQDARKALAMVEPQLTKDQLGEARYRAKEWRLAKQRELARKRDSGPR